LKGTPDIGTGNNRCAGGWERAEGMKVGHDINGGIQIDSIKKATVTSQSTMKRLEKKA
jgi:hypothetical protein